MKSLNSNQVSKFWKWFADSIASLEDELITQEVIGQINNKIDEIGNFSWEMGPGFRKSRMFTISPNGSKELLQSTKAIIAAAPKLENWEFYHAKQPKVTDLNFILCIGEDPFHFDASTWEYVLLSFPDQTYDILIKSRNIFRLSINDQYLAVTLALDSILGEEKRIELITEIDILENFDSEYNNSIGRFSDLLSHFKQVIRANLSN